MLRVNRVINNNVISVLEDDRAAEVYLERLYGDGWRVPDPHFSHAWNLSAYADITGRPTTAAGSQVSPSPQESDPPQPQ